MSDESGGNPAYEASLEIPLEGLYDPLDLEAASAYPVTTLSEKEMEWLCEIRCKLEKPDPEENKMHLKSMLEFCRDQVGNMFGLISPPITRSVSCEIAQQDDIKPLTTRDLQSQEIFQTFEHCQSNVAAFMDNFEEDTTEYNKTILLFYQIFVNAHTILKALETKDDFSKLYFISNIIDKIFNHPAPATLMTHFFREFIPPLVTL